MNISIYAVDLDKSSSRGKNTTIDLPFNHCEVKRESDNLVIRGDDNESRNIDDSVHRAIEITMNKEELKELIEMLRRDQIVE